MKMKVVGLVSGGKDSCYNLMLCVAAGHSVVALAHIKPHTGDEQDSMMYQSVGHEGVALYADAMGLPLYVGTTLGKACQTGLQYERETGDEVEDLVELLTRVKEDIDIEGVAVGAVLSDYQRIRVENVCQRLGLVSLAYLWQQDQLSLVKDMISAKVEAVLIKVASIGLEVSHLGKTIEEMLPTLQKLNSKFGVSVCGEGGEYESFTLDCPLFKKKIIIVESETILHSDDAYAPVAYLKLKKLVLQEKVPVMPPSAMPPVCYPSLMKLKQEKIQSEESTLTAITTPLSQVKVRDNKWMWLAVDGDSAYSSISDQSSQLLQSLSDILKQYSLTWNNVAIVYLYLKDMTDYSTVNALYSPVITNRPPARVCIATDCLPHGILLRMELVITMETGNTSNMHVQSLSYWAPPNIGPYSQAYTVGDVVFLAGEIGLEPHLNRLAEPIQQLSLSLDHSLALLTANQSSLDHCLYGICYCVTMDTVMKAKGTWKNFMKCNGVGLRCPVVYLIVHDLPRGADVEWHFVATKKTSDVNYDSECLIDDSLRFLIHTHTATSTSTNEEYLLTEQPSSIGCRMVSVTPLPTCISMSEDSLLMDGLRLACTQLTSTSSLSSLDHSFIMFKIYVPILTTNLDFMCMNDVIKECLPIVEENSNCTSNSYMVVPYKGVFSEQCPLTLQYICL